MNTIKINKEHLLQKLDIHNFYSELLTPFKDSGKEWLTVRCPFHDDKTPSLGINLKHGGFVCHVGSCGKRGDLFTFYMELRNVDFKTALKEIANLCGALNYE